jgi:hypothetical protein
MLSDNTRDPDVLDIPRAPNPPNIQPQTPTSSLQFIPELRERSSRHMIYATEILIFTLVGWGWLAVREFMGATPVMDTSVLICLLITALANLVLALVYHTTDQFKTAAQGFFAHTLSLFILYVYSLLESVTPNWGPLCCDGASSFSVTKTYAAAYFGALPLHQTAGAITAAFLFVLLVLAAGQVRVCLPDPREWLTGKVSTAVACLVSFHLGLFTLNSKACDGEMGGAVIGIATVAWVLMLDIPAVLWLTRTPITLIQMISEWTFSVLIAGVAGVLSARLGGGSSVLMLILGGVILWQSVALGLKIWKLTRREESAPPLNSNLTLNSKWKHRPAGEMRLLGRVDKKAW